MKKLALFLLSGILPLVTACGQQLQNTTEQNSELNTFSVKVKAPVISLATYDIKGIFKSDKSVNTTKEIALNKAIHEIDNDIVVFQEVDSSDSFKRFSDKYLKDMKYNFYSRTNSSLGKINMVVLSKFPVSETRAGNPVVPGTLLMRTKIQVTPDYSFSIFSTFIKPADASGYSKSKRDADIEQVKEYIRGVQKSFFGEKFTVVGNLNNKPDADDLQTILDPRASGLSIHDVVTEDMGNDNNTFTYRSTKGNARFDYVMVAAGMFDEYITNSVKIYRDADKASDKFFMDASEHYPLSVKFDLSKSSSDIHARS